VLIGVISVVPWTKVVGMSARMASAAIKAGAGKAAPILLQKEVEAALKKDFGERAMEWTASEIADTATRLSTWNLVKDAGAAYLQKTVKENLLKSSFKYSLSVATKAGVLSGADAIAEALSKSMIDRLTPQGSYVTLKQDYAAPERLIEATSVPVMVKWTPESTQTYDVFHLASPCHLDQFTFQKSNIICGTYVNGRGLTYCNCDPKTNQCDIPTSGEKYMQCGSFDASLDTVSGYSGLYDKIKGYLSSNSDRKIVDYTLDSDGKASNVKLYLPWTDGDYLSDFNKESTGASSFFSTRDVSNDLFLSATLYDKQGKTKGTQKLRCATAGSENACYDGNSGSADSASFMFSATTPVTVKSSGGDIGIGVGAGMRIAYSLNYDTK
jgi:hypothetical protein